MPNDYESFLIALGNRESSGDFTKVNSLGFLGLYQFGEAALIDIGLVNRDTNAYDNKFNGGWTGLYGVNSKLEFLDNPVAQAFAIRDYQQLLWNRIVNNGYDEMMLQ